MRDKYEELSGLFSEWKGCTRCELGKLRESKNKRTNGFSGNMAMGEGNPDASIFILGTAPAVEEDKKGRVFVGESGDILNEYLDSVNIKRGEDTFITNLVSCRSFSETENEKGRLREENRDPTPAERRECRPLWEEALYIVDPLLVIGLGKLAIKELTKKAVSSIHNIQGTVDECVINKRVKDIKYPVMCMYHPAFLARSGDHFHGGPWHKQYVAFQRTAYLLDRLKNKYYGTEIPKRKFKESDLFLVEGGLPK